jgi:O-antigen/teichoic acid export membrane protein
MMGRGTLSYIITRLLQIIAMVATIKIMTMQLVPADLAKYNIIMIIYGAFALLLINPVGVYMNRRQHEWSDAGVFRNRVLKCMLYFVGVSLLAVFIIHFFLQSLQTRFGIENHWLIICVSASLILSSLNTSLINYINLQGYFTAFAVLTNLTLWSGLFLAYWLTNLNHNAIYWFMGILIGQSLGMLAAIIPFIKKTQLRSDVNIKPLTEHTLRSSLNFMIPVGVGVGLGWIQYQSYRLMIGYDINLHYLGLFIAGYAISSGIFQAFEVTVQQYTSPTFYQQINGKSRADIARIWKDYYQTLIPMIFLVMVFIIAMSKPLLHILVDAKYWDSVQFVILGAFVEALRVLGNVYILATQAIMKTSRTLIPQLSGAMLVVILVSLGIYLKKPEFVGVALIASGMVYVALLHIQVMRLMNIKLELAHKSKTFGATLCFALMYIIIQYYDIDLLGSIIFLSLSGLLYLLVNYTIVRRTIWFIRPV